MFFRFAGFFESSRGVFMGLAGKLVGGWAPLTMRGCSRGVGMSGEVVEFSDSFVRALGHRDFPLRG